MTGSEGMKEIREKYNAITGEINIDNYIEKFELMRELILKIIDKLEETEDWVWEMSMGDDI